MTLSIPFPPSGYVRRRLGESDVVALETAAGAVADALASQPTLARWAAGRAQREVGGGRGPVWRLDLGGTP